ncbi:MAG TPA: hypothetical protein VFE36_02955 [Candidatus Baltobacteraceae bacterium]|nr:hypothetical protein [Candidatus Baltobacteraceae bacterium]
MATTMGARDLFRMVRQGLDVRSVHAHVRRPFRFLLCGDPGLVAELRALLLSGTSDEPVPADAAACLETIYPHTFVADGAGDVRAAIFLGRRGDTPNLEPLRALKIPILAVTVEAEALPSSPNSLPAAGNIGEYTVPAITREALRQRVFAHLVDAARGVEIAVGRRLPPLRESVAAKLTRDAAANALKVSIASAVVDHIPVLGVVLGAVASAGDMVAITGIQMMLMLHIEAAYGRDPDVQRMWQLLPVVGAGFGWRALAREVSGFIPVAGIPLKGAIAYAGTIVVGEGVAFFLEHGKHMSKGQAAQIYERTKEDTLRFARDFVSKLKNKE